VTDDKWREAWLSKQSGEPYGDLFFARATGQAPEMECSKAAAARLAPLMRDGSRVLDVGCGAGHYYHSLRKVGTTAFEYVGLDPTPYYIDRARKAFDGDTSASFVVGDVFGVQFPDRSFDAVLCSNVLLHLPSIRRPIAELSRVARSHLLIRTLVYDTSYVILDVRPGADGDDFDEDDRPRGFHYLNIYSEKYVRRLLASNPRVKHVRFERDTEFSPARVSDTAALLPHAWDGTRVIDGMQASGPVLMPWSWITVTFT
jgi:ubiquinone/menaquinone biosynthesis C-methylase UbiE